MQSEPQWPRHKIFLYNFVIILVYLLLDSYVPTYDVKRPQNLTSLHKRVWSYYIINVMLLRCLQNINIKVFTAKAARPQTR